MNVFQVLLTLLATKIPFIDSNNHFKAQGSHFEIPPSKEKLEAGRKALTNIESEAQQSQCWKGAVQNLHTGCKKLTDVEQSYLAIDFTNCHLEKSGRQTYPCTRMQTVRECTQSMDQTAFMTYTSFFTHTSNICFFLQSQAWQERTEKTVTKLSKASEEVADQLEDSLKNQLQVLHHQNKSLVNQKKILQHERNLTDTLASSTMDAKKAFEEMKERAHEQRALFSETFDMIFKKVESIKQLQSMILGEFISLQSLAFHIVAVCVCYFFTSTPRTSEARLLLFVGLAVLIAVERIVASWSVGKDDQLQSETIHGRLWVCRKIFIFAAMVVLFYVAIKYQDYSKINHNMLMEIGHQIREIKAIRQAEKEKALKAITNGEQAGCRSVDNGKALGGTLFYPSIHQQTGRSSFHDITDAGPSSADSDVEEDPTFVPRNSLSVLSEDEDSCQTDGEITQSFSEQPSYQELRTPKSKTHSKHVTPIKTSTPRKRRSQSKASSSQSPSPSHSYNLRPRRSTTSSPYMLRRSFVENVPSPSTLEELIENLKNNTPLRYSLIEKSKKDDNAGFFSSDEEN